MNKGSKHSEETKKKMSRVAKKRLKNKENHPMYGKQHTKDAKEKNRLWHLGRKLPPFTEEHKKKIGEANKISLLGKKLPDEVKQKIGKGNRGKIVSAETKLKMRKNALKQFKNGMPKETLIKLRKIWDTEEFKGKYRNLPQRFKKGDIKLIERRAKQIFPKKDTKIEVKIQNFLKQLNIEFFTHQYMKEIEHSYQCDILIPSMNLVIECDGDYWHKYPIGKDIDHIRTKELIEKGFKILRLWEREIKEMSVEVFKERLYEN